MAFHCPDKYGAIDGIRTRDPQLGKLRGIAQYVPYTQYFASSVFSCARFCTQFKLKRQI